MYPRLWLILIIGIYIYIYSYVEQCRIYETGAIINYIKHKNDQRHKKSCQIFIQPVPSSE